MLQKYEKIKKIIKVLKKNADIKHVKYKCRKEGEAYEQF